MAASKAKKIGGNQKNAPNNRSSARLRKKAAGTNIEKAAVEEEETEYSEGGNLQADPSKPSPDGKCHFFRLPPEIRNIIYEDVLHTNVKAKHVLLVGAPRGTIDEEENSRVPYKHPALVLVSRQTYLETQSLVFRCSILHVRLGTMAMAELLDRNPATRLGQRTLRPRLSKFAVDGFFKALPNFKFILLEFRLATIKGCAGSPFSELFRVPDQLGKLCDFVQSLQTVVKPRFIIGRSWLTLSTEIPERWLMNPMCIRSRCKACRPIFGRMAAGLERCITQHGEANILCNDHLHLMDWRTRSLKKTNPMFYHHADKLKIIHGNLEEESWDDVKKGISCFI